MQSERKPISVDSARNTCTLCDASSATRNYLSRARSSLPDWRQASTTLDLLLYPRGSESMSAAHVLVGQRSFRFHALICASRPHIVANAEAGLCSSFRLCQHRSHTCIDYRLSRIAHTLDMQQINLIFPIHLVDSTCRAAFDVALSTEGTAHWCPQMQPIGVQKRAFSSICTTSTSELRAALFDGIFTLYCLL